MKAVVKLQPGPGLSLAEVPIPEPGVDDVLIRIRRAAICGTDVHIYQWDDWAQRTVKTPLVVGPEFAGVVAAVGSNVKDIHGGEVVSGEGHLVCGHCRNCLAGRRHLCTNPVGIGVNRDGAFADYLCIPKGNVWFAHSSIPMDTLAYFDPLGNATHSALSFDMVGEDVLITGAGPVGLMTCAIARHIGARHVVVFDINPYRVELARKMGATLAIDARDHSLDWAQQQLGMKEGFDVGLEMSGSADAFREMVDNMVHGGKIALLGILPSDAWLDWTKVIFNSLTIHGIYGRQVFETWYKMTAMLQSGLDVSPVLTHRFPVEEFEQGFAVMREGRCGKVLLDWSD
ncbi:MAG: L-threonine 3-dehydrogenase [Armatimonadetes bacterium]|nr:L-threonine 3-dehydrogenase [Armatimonadota bacterium]